VIEYILPENSLSYAVNETEFYIRSGAMIPYYRSVLDFRTV